MPGTSRELRPARESSSVRIQLAVISRLINYSWALTLRSISVSLLTVAHLGSISLTNHPSSSLCLPTPCGKNCPFCIVKKQIQPFFQVSPPHHLFLVHPLALHQEM
ncbi:acylphosphatase-2 [Platysternon megacephalum]|uniref:Acylphosphatase-2 n=1 Tax=Platysternon megacephalum TaxID=55544 RepID=A0A4D9DW07_9SAUR|nr:acylphosphatase-2 [Platysternon megacephalum]